ncbi:MAG: prepilin peptidase [Candidatus Aenigmatarchaeota archaeon]|nr:MAG: prepilin peptidase [Candidatus Aenigmarchaeota archaeon]
MLVLVLENLPLYVALVGSATAGYIDLRTTEIPDEIPLSMAVFGLFWAALAYVTSGSAILVQSAIVGGLFFALGYVMYYTGQWGGGDAKLMAAIGVLVPQAPAFAVATLFPFAMSMLLNVFMLGAVYIVAYSLTVSLPNRTVTRAFLVDVKGGMKEIGIFAVALTIAVVAAVRFATGGFSQASLTFAFSLVPGGLGLFLLWKFLRVVERVGFQKRIKTQALRVGDMLGEDVRELKMYKKLLRGLEENEIRKIRRVRRMILIREGVRFGPVFMLALLYTIFYGDVMALFSVV